MIKSCYLSSESEFLFFSTLCIDEFLSCNLQDKHGTCCVELWSNNNSIDEKCKNAITFTCQIFLLLTIERKKCISKENEYFVALLIHIVIAKAFD